MIEGIIISQNSFPNIAATKMGIFTGIFSCVNQNNHYERWRLTKEQIETKEETLTLRNKLSFAHLIR